MGSIKVAVAKVKNNPAGAVIGAVAVFYAAKKFGKVENKWALGGLAIVGLFAGAAVQSRMRAKASAPTASTVTSPAK